MLEHPRYDLLHVVVFQKKFSGHGFLSNYHLLLLDFYDGVDLLYPRLVGLGGNVVPFKLGSPILEARSDHFSQYLKLDYLWRKLLLLLLHNASLLQVFVET